MDAPPEVVIPVLREMKAKGKAVLGMKIFGAGELVGRKDECLRFALGLDCVDAFTIGAETREQFTDLVKSRPAAAEGSERLYALPALCPPDADRAETTLLHLDLAWCAPRGPCALPNNRSHPSSRSSALNP